MTDSGISVTLFWVLSPVLASLLLLWTQNMEILLLAGPLSPEGVVSPPFQTTGLRHHHLLYTGGGGEGLYVCLISFVTRLWL